MMAEFQYAMTAAQLREQGKDPRCIIPEKKTRFVGRCGKKACRKKYAYDMYFDAYAAPVDVHGYVVPVRNRRRSVNQTEIPQYCDCGGYIRFERVKGTYNPDHVCNAKCMSAIGPICSCECGGANHGGSFMMG